MKHYFYICILLVVLICSCTEHKEHKYVIGVSLSSMDNWRNQLRKEMKEFKYFDPNIDVNIVSDEDYSQKQSDQINMLIDEGVDVLVVSPSYKDSLVEAINRAYENHIPVIFYGHKLDTCHYTAYIGADNYNIGYSIGQYMCARLRGRGNVVELKGLKDYMPTIERHQGFMDAIAKCPGIRIIASEYADYKAEPATKVMDSILNKRTDIDYVFGHNDIMAHAAYKCVKKHGIKRTILYSGVDALNIPGGGLELVRDGKISATCTYPTRGDKVIELALKILHGEKYAKVNKLKTTVITPTNVGIMIQFAQELERQENNLELLYHQIDEYLKEYEQNRLINIFVFVFILFIIIRTIILYIANRKKGKKIKELQDRIIRLTRR